MIDPTRDKLEPVRGLLSTILNRKVHPGTIWRWTQVGMRNGARLETVRIGARLFSTAEAVRRFADACADHTSIELPGDQVPMTIIPGPTKSRATDAELKACGLL